MDYKLPAGRERAADVNVLPVLRPSSVSRRIWKGGNGISIPCSRKPARSAGGSHGAAAYGVPSRRRRYAARKSDPLLQINQKTSGGGLSITSEQRSAAVYRICVTSSLLASDGAGTVSTTRVTESDSDQLINCSVINALFGTMISLRSQSLMVVARVLIPVTLPVRSRMVTVSPIRIGFSNRMIRPETKLAKISCKPKPGLRSGRQPAIAVLTIRYQSSRSQPAHQTA